MLTIIKTLRCFREFFRCAIKSKQAHFTYPLLPLNLWTSTVTCVKAIFQVICPGLNAISFPVLSLCSLQLSPCVNGAGYFPASYGKQREHKELLLSAKDTWLVLSASFLLTQLIFLLMGPCDSERHTLKLSVELLVFWKWKAIVS